MKKNFLALLLFLTLLVGCGQNPSSSNNADSTLSSSQTSENHDLKFKQAVENLGNNYTISQVQTNPYTGVQYYESFRQFTDEGFLNKDGTGRFIPRSDNMYIHDFYYDTNQFVAYGRTDKASEYDALSITYLLNKYIDEFQYMSQGDYYDIYYDKGVYELFDYFNITYYIDSYGEGTDVYLFIGEDGNFESIYFVSENPGTLYILSIFYFQNIGKTSLSFINSFNESNSNDFYNRIIDIKSFDENYLSFYHNQNVKARGYVSAFTHEGYILQDQDGIGAYVLEKDTSDYHIGDFIEVECFVETNKLSTTLLAKGRPTILLSGQQDKYQIFTDDVKTHGRHGYYASTMFYPYPEYSGSLYNTGFTLENVGSWEFNEDLNLTFKYADVLNSQGKPLSGQLIIPKGLSNETKQSFYDEFVSKGDGKYIVNNVVVVFDMNAQFYIKMYACEQTTFVKDLSLEEKMELYLGQVIPIPEFSDDYYSVYVDDEIWAVKDVKQPNLTIFGVKNYEENLQDLQQTQLAYEYKDMLIEEYGFQVYHHFGEYLNYEFFVLINGDSVIEFAFLYQGGVFSGGTLNMHLALYQGQPIIPPSISDKMNDLFGNDDFVLPDNSDDHSFTTYQYNHIYDSDVDGLLLYLRDNNSYLTDYQAKLLNSSYEKVDEYISRGVTHYIYSKNNKYIDVSQYQQDDFAHGLNYEKQYRLEILIYENISAVKPNLTNSLTEFFNDLNADSLSYTQGSDISECFPKDMSLPEGIMAECFYTKNTFAPDDAITGGYAPNVYLYCVKDENGSYQDSVDFVFNYVKDMLIEAGFEYIDYNNNPYYPAGTCALTYTKEGAQFASAYLILTPRPNKGYVLLKSL